MRDMWCTASAAFSSSAYARASLQPAVTRLPRLFRCAESCPYHLHALLLLPYVNAQHLQLNDSTVAASLRDGRNSLQQLL